MATLTAAATLSSTVTLVASHAGDANAALAVSVSLVPNGVVYENELNTNSDFMQLPAYTGSSSVEAANVITLPAYTCSSTMLNGGVANTNELFTKLPAYTSSGSILNGNEIAVSLVLPAYTVEAQMWHEQVITLPAYTLAAEMISGGLMSVASRLPSYTCEASCSNENVISGGVNVTLPTYTLESSVTAENIINVNATLGRITLAAECYSGNVINVSVELPAYTIDAEGAADGIGNVEVVLPGIQLQSTMSNASAEPDPSNAYTMNLATRALTKYEGFGYNSFANFNGTSLAAGPDGIFAITGETDNGVAIDASIKTVLPNATISRAREAVVNCRTNGDVVLQVIPDETNDIYEYNLAVYSDTLKKQKIKLGRGIKAENMEIVIRNRDGADFEIDYLDVVTDQTRRKR